MWKEIFYVLSLKKEKKISFCWNKSWYPLKQLLKYQWTVRRCIINVTSLKSSLVINNWTINTAVVMGNKRGSDKNMLRRSLHGLGFCVCYVTASPPRLFYSSWECWVTLAPSDVCSVHPLTAFANEHSALPNCSFFSPFPPLSAFISKCEGSMGE